MQTKASSKFSPMIGYSLFYSSLLFLLVGCFCTVLNQLLYLEHSNFSVVLPVSGMLLFGVAALTLLAALQKSRRAVLSTLLAMLVILLFYSPLFALVVPNTTVATLSALQLVCWLLFITGWFGWLRRSQSGWRWFSQGCHGLLLLIVVGVIWQDTGTLYGYSLGVSPSVALNTAIFLLFCAVAGLAAPFASVFRIAEHKASPGSWLALLLSAAAVLLWLNFMHQIAATNKQVVSETMGKFQQQLDQILNEQRGLMYRLADRLVSSPLPYPIVSLQLELNSYLRDFSYLDYLAVTAQDGQLQYSMSQSEQDRRWFDQYLVDSELLAKTIEATSRPYITFFMIAR